MKHITTISQLGFSSCEDYFTSKWWKKVCAEVLERDGHECRLCGSDTNIVQHLDNKDETLLGQTLHNLVSVCVDCHETLNYVRTGEKRSLRNTKLTYNRLRKSNKSVVFYRNQKRKPLPAR